jgi:hypothetical protein
MHMPAEPSLFITTALLYSQIQINQEGGSGDLVGGNPLIHLLSPVIECNPPLKEARPTTTCRPIQELRCRRRLLTQQLKAARRWLAVRSLCKTWHLTVRVQLPNVRVRAFAVERLATMRTCAPLLRVTAVVKMAIKLPIAQPERHREEAIGELATPCQVLTSRRWFVMPLQRHRIRGNPR